jgi:DNA or RNA helicases of superfamily II
MQAYHAASGSVAVEFCSIDLFSDAFGAEKAGFLYSQYHFYDIYQNSRYADFLLETDGRRIAFEIDDEASHNRTIVSSNKFYDDLLKQNSMVYLGWDVYRWAVRQMQSQPETVKDELRIFLGQHPRFREIEDYLPMQRGRSMDGTNLELKQHQIEALESLQRMRENKETIALLYHATGTGKTFTAVMDAKRFGGRVLFLAHTQELVNQAYQSFLRLWPEASAGRYMEGIKETNAHVVCGSIQSVALHLEDFRDDAFDYLIIDEAHHASADTYQKVLLYFKPRFTLGLTATPERTDDIKRFWIFSKTPHTSWIFKLL